MTATHNPATEKSTKKAKDANARGKAKKRKGKSPTGSRGRTAAEVQRFIEEKNWKEARSLLQEELVFEPMDHWLWFTLSLTYYEEKEYAKALACSKRAVELAPNCPLALWHYAGSLYMADQETSAFTIWTLLLNMDIEDIAYGEHGEGFDWALQLVNDVQYRLGRYYQHQGMNEPAKESFGKYLHNRKHCVGSIYDVDTVEAYLSQLA